MWCAESDNNSLIIRYLVKQGALTNLLDNVCIILILICNLTLTSTTLRVTQFQHDIMYHKSGICFFFVLFVYLKEFLSIPSF